MVQRLRGCSRAGRRTCQLRIGPNSRLLQGPHLPELHQQSIDDRLPPPAVQSQESLYVDLEREAVEEDLGHQVDPLQLLAQDPSADPIQSMLLASLQQNQILLQKLVGSRTNDPVLKALGGGGSDSASAGSSSGVRGCLARDVFIRAVQDLPTVAAVVRAAAIKELGLSPGTEDSNLLRKYMERRIPLADHNCFWIEIEFEDELCCGGWNSIFFTSWPIVHSPRGRS